MNYPGKIIVVSPMYNAAPWLHELIESLSNQTVPFCCYIMDDQSTDGSADIAETLTQGDARFNIVRNPQKRYALGGMIEGARLACPKDDDIIVLIDADDYLRTSKAFEHVLERYQNPDVWLTYGNYADTNDTTPEIKAPYPDNVLSKNRFRSVRWRASHLKTMKYKVLRHIPQEQFKVSQEELDRLANRLRRSLRWRTAKHIEQIALHELHEETGRYIKRCCDKAIMYPALELAGKHIAFIDELLYAYRTYPKEPTFQTASSDKWHRRCLRYILEQRSSLTPLSK